MPENDQKETGGTNTYLKFTGVGFQMIAIIGVFAYVGYRIDKSAHHTTQWVTAMLALIGVFIALYVVIRALKD
jgi:F0F1-type ATP synthase assembly protein I